MLKYANFLSKMEYWAYYKILYLIKYFVFQNIQLN